MAECSTLAVFAGETNVVALAKKRAQCQKFAHRPVEGEIVGDGPASTVEDAFELAMKREPFRDRAQGFAYLLQPCSWNGCGNHFMVVVE